MVLVKVIFVLLTVHGLGSAHGRVVEAGAGKPKFQRMNIMRTVTLGGQSMFDLEDDPEPVEKQSKTCQNVRMNATKVGAHAPIRSPNWPGDYPINQDCSYHITSPVDTQIVISCDINIVCKKPNDYIFWSLTGDRDFGDAEGFCGQGRLERRTSNGNALSLGFHSEADQRPRSRLPYRWRCHFRVVRAPPTATTTPRPEPTTTPGGTVIIPPPGGSGPNNCSCGIANPKGVARIVGGFRAKRNEIPWRVAVFIYDRKTKSGGLCGGTVISNSWVMTAAHCTRRYQRGYGISVYTEAVSNPVTVGSGVEFTVDRFIEHPRYNKDNFDNDISLLHLSKPIQYSAKVSPACLPYGPLSRSDHNGVDVTASGWGTTDPVPADSPPPDDAVVSDYLREVKLPVLSSEQCALYQRVTENQFCTYEPGKDTCQGDSGGSIDYQYHNDRFYAIGIVSFGAGCAQVDHPGAYTKVNNYLSWIESAAGESFCQPKF